MRDDFSKTVIEALGKRVAYHCSFPGCDATTVGPSDESSTSVNNVGTAAHITAASPDGPRFDPTLTPEERRAADNGIYMCALHGRMIDNDVSRFSVATLRAWKREAEERAREEFNQESRRVDPSRLRLRVADMTCSTDVNDAIGEALHGW